MAHFSPTDNAWLPDGTPASLATKTSSTPFFWPPTNSWVTGTVTEVQAAPDPTGRPRFCKRTNSWTTGTC